MKINAKSLNTENGFLPVKKTYNPLVLLDRWIFRNYRDTKVGSFICNMFDNLWAFTVGVKNIIHWVPTIYNDRNWDYSSTYTILYKKIYLLRKNIVENNRHSDVDITKFWTSLVLDLIDKIQQEDYRTEYFDYIKKNHDFVKLDKYDSDGKPYYEMKSTVISDNTQSYVDMNRSKVRILSKKYDFWNDLSSEDKAIYISQYKHDQARKLLFNILSEKIEFWWD